MSMKCKIVQKHNPSKPQEPKKWYGVPKSESPLDVKALTRAATANSTTGPKELEAALELLSNYISQQLLQGHTVKLPGIGSLRLSFRSKGADSVQEFKASEMLYDPRILFTADPELRSRVIDNLTFEDGGVQDGTIHYATRSDYYIATGQAPAPDTPSQGGGGQGGGSGEEPLG